MQKIINNANYTLSILYLGNGVIHNTDLIANYLANLNNEDIHEIILSIRALSRLRLEKELELRIVRNNGECIYIHFEEGKLVSYIHYVVIDKEVFNVTYRNNLLKFDFTNNILYSNTSLSEEVNKEMNFLKRVIKK